MPPIDLPEGTRRLDEAGKRLAFAYAVWKYANQQYGKALGFEDSVSDG
jgi:hypothetical protein